MKTLKLFNAVISKKSHEQSFVSGDGYIIEPKALWAKDRIIEYYRQEALNGNDLNKTFHKSWQKIKESTRVDLAIEQILHYLSTYGTDFQAEIYIPDEVLEVPETKIVFKVIKAYTKDVIRDKCLSLLKSGVALKEDTVDDLLSILVDGTGYQFTGKEGIRNKEATVKIADLYGVIPCDTMGFLRYIMYRATGSTLLIKNTEAIEAIKACSYNPSAQFGKFGIERLAENFNRFKPLFLAFKNKCPKTINRISRLSKTCHKPMVQNALNEATQRELTNKDRHWLDNATPYSLFKALSACWARVKGQSAFVYRIRNGKSWVAENISKSVNLENYKFILDYLKERYALKGRKIFIPEGVEYALPTTEKMYVGNIPTGTKFCGEKLAVGIYWKDEWGARDLDLSGLGLSGKIGWNASYGQGGDNRGIMYSGDITSAPRGAVEYLYADKKLSQPTLIKMNVFSGDDTAGYKIIVGKGDEIDKKYMMNPNNLFMEARCQAVQRQMILGLWIPEERGQSFVLLNFGAGHTRVSASSEIGTIARQALLQQWRSPVSLNSLIQALGAEIVEGKECADIDLSLNNLEKDSFTKIFSLFSEDKGVKKCSM